MSLLGGDGAAEPAVGSKLSARTRFAQSHILQCFQDVGPPPSDVSAEGALRDLLSKSFYYSAMSNDILPYSKEKVSWPDCGSEPIPLSSNLLTADRDMRFDWKDDMLRDDADHHNHMSTSPTCKPM